MTGTFLAMDSETMISKIYYSAEWSWGEADLKRDTNSSATY